MVPFGGWLMPVQYSGIVDEHQSVRNAVGMFDISHMGQFVVSGNGTRDWLNTMLTNNAAKLDVGQGQYTFLLNDNGGVIDDLIVYRTGWKSFFVQMMQQGCGTSFWAAGKNSTPNHAASAHATRCAWKCVIRSMAPIFRPNAIRSKPVSDFSSTSRNASSSGATNCWRQ